MCTGSLQGYFCPTRSRRPQKCPPLLHCAEGSSFPALNLAGLLIILAALVAYLALHCAAQRLRSRRAKRSEARDVLRTQVSRCCSLLENVLKGAGFQQEMSGAVMRRCGTC